MASGTGATTGLGWAPVPKFDAARLEVETRRITGVAIHYRGRTYSKPPPNRHHDVIRSIGGIGGPSIQGFIDNRGVFLDRRAALQVALAAGQVLDPAAVRADQLFSEDLW